MLVSREVDSLVQSWHVADTVWLFDSGNLKTQVSTAYLILTASKARSALVSRSTQILLKIPSIPDLHNAHPRSVCFVC